MESTLSATTALLTVSETLNSSSYPIISRLPHHFWRTRTSQCLRSQLVSLRFRRSESQGSKALSSISYSSSSLRNLCDVAVPPVGSRLKCVANSAVGSGGGDGASGGGEAKSNSVVGGSEEFSALSPDVIILDVGGMMCGGCAASVKRILESQPQVLSASVNLATETAIVCPVSEAKVMPNWQKHLGEPLAMHLTSCGFKSNLRGMCQG